MRCRLLLPTLLLARTIAAQAPSSVPVADVPFDEAHFTDAQGLEQAQEAIRQGDALMARGGKDLKEALLQYEHAQAFNPANAELNTRIGVCHLNGPTPHEALPYFLRAEALAPSAPRIHFLVGYAYQLNARWDEAMKEFQFHRAIITRTPDADRTYNMADKHLAECRYGKASMAHPAQATVSNLGPVNGPEADYGVLVTTDGNELFFTSRRTNTTGGRINKATNAYFEDIYACTRTAQGWSEPAPLAAPVNTTGNDASVGLRPDGRTLVIFRDGKNGGDLLVTSRTATGWGTPAPLGGTINTGAEETSAWYSDDSQWLYFASAREGGVGGSDIYRSRWDATRSDWGPAENLGPTVNSIYDEDGVFVQGDGSTIYFGSQGHSSMGGFDLFKSSFVNGTWTAPVNLGWPINSPGDDLFFMLSPDGSTGYFSSVRPGGAGEDDIYRVDMRPAVDESALLVSAAGGVPMKEAPSAEMIRLKGFIKGLHLMNGMEARIALMDLQDTQPVFIANSDAQSGAFSVEVPRGHDYAFTVTAPGYLLHSESLPASGSTDDVELDITMQPLEKGNTEQLRNVFFEANSAALNEFSRAELGQLVELLRANPGLRLGITGHTDDLIGPIDNTELSLARARVVVEHLVAQGIEAARLEASGHGAEQPAVPNDTPEHKARNRRTEIHVL